MSSQPTHGNQIEPAGQTRFSETVARLERLTGNLRMLGALVITSTFCNLSWLIGILVFSRRFSLRMPTFAVLPAVFGLLGFILPIFFEAVRKVGDVLFEEISDELQWYVRRRSPDRADKGAVSETASPIARKRPRLKTRVALREFASTANLPLISGPRGPLIYVAMNLIVTLLVVIWYSVAM